MKCIHPDHIDGESCEDYAVNCHEDCTCCAPYENRPQVCAHNNRNHGACLDCGCLLGWNGDYFYVLEGK